MYIVGTDREQLQYAEEGGVYIGGAKLLLLKQFTAGVPFQQAVGC